MNGKSCTQIVSVFKFRELFRVCLYSGLPRPCTVPFSHVTPPAALIYHNTVMVLYWSDITNRVRPHRHNCTIVSPPTFDRFDAVSDDGHVTGNETQSQRTIKAMLRL